MEQRLDRRRWINQINRVDAEERGFDFDGVIGERVPGHMAWRYTHTRQGDMCGMAEGPVLIKLMFTSLGVRALLKTIVRGVIHSLRVCHYTTRYFRSGHPDYLQPSLPFLEGRKS